MFGSFQTYILNTIKHMHLTYRFVMIVPNKAVVKNIHVMYTENDSIWTLTNPRRNEI